MDMDDSTLAEAFYDSALMRDKGDPELPNLFHDLGAIFWERYWKAKRASDLDRVISCYTESIQVTHYVDPQLIRRRGMLVLALTTRFRNDGDVTDLNKACSTYNRETILYVQNINAYACSALIALAEALQARFQQLGSVSDLESSLAAIQKAIASMPDTHPELPKSLIFLGLSFKLRFERFGNISDLESAIAAQKELLKLVPDTHPAKLVAGTNLGQLLQQRFERLGYDSDLEESLTTLRMVDDLTPDTDIYKSGRLVGLGCSLRARFVRFGDLSDLEEAIKFQKRAVELTSDTHPDRPVLLTNLGHSL